MTFQVARPTITADSKAERKRAALERRQQREVVSPAAAAIGSSDDDIITVDDMSNAAGVGGGERPRRPASRVKEKKPRERRGPRRTRGKSPGVPSDSEDDENASLLGESGFHQPDRW